MSAWASVAVLVGCAAGLGVGWLLASAGVAELRSSVRYLTGELERLYTERHEGIDAAHELWVGTAREADR